MKSYKLFSGIKYDQYISIHMYTPIYAHVRVCVCVWVCDDDVYSIKYKNVINICRDDPIKFQNECLFHALESLTVWNFRLEAVCNSLHMTPELNEFILASDKVYTLPMNGETHEKMKLYVHRI